MQRIERHYAVPKPHSADLIDVQKLPNGQRGMKAGKYLGTPSTCGYIPVVLHRQIFVEHKASNRVLKQLPHAQRDAMRYVEPW
jgi:hypothetical protein